MFWVTEDVSNANEITGKRSQKKTLGPFGLLSSTTTQSPHLREVYDAIIFHYMMEVSEELFEVSPHENRCETSKAQTTSDVRYITDVSTSTLAHLQKCLQGNI
ncbi:hypothetical protein HHI36_000592, partial [Cryptolaemus montrouzieri]